MLRNKNTFLGTLLAVVALNYLAQFPYYIHQYYAPHKFLPSLYGSFMLAITLIWFLIAYQLLRHGSKRGYYLMLSFLAVEFLFYLQTQISQLMIRHQVLLHVYHPDNVLLFLVFGIGYVNFIAAAYFMWHLVRHKTTFIGQRIS